MSTSPEDELQLLRQRVAASPSDLQLRFELGAALCRRRDYTPAIPELQGAMNHPQFFRKASELLAQAFDAKGMPELAIAMRRRASGDPLDGGGSAPVPVPATPRPPRLPDASAAQQIPEDENSA